jgi:hypothetical protein
VETIFKSIRLELVVLKEGFSRTYGVQLASSFLLVFLIRPVRNFFHDIRSQMKHGYPVLFIARFIRIVDAVSFDHGELFGRECKCVPAAQK